LAEFLARLRSGTTSTALTERDTGTLVMERVVAAMCHHQLGQHDRAKQSLENARAVHRDELLRRSSGLRGVAWGHDDIIAEALARIEGPK
jgi:hypothetical protein